MTADWRFLAVRLAGDGTSEVVHDDLPVSGPLTDVLSGPPTCNFTVPERWKGLDAADGLPLFEEWGTAIFAERDGVIQPGGGIITGVLPNQDRGLDVECMGYTSYPADQPYLDSVSYVDADALDIYRHIWEWLQTRTGGNLGLVLDQRKSGVLLGKQVEDVQFTSSTGESVNFEAGPYKLAWYLTENLGKNLDDLASNTPFDYYERHFWEGGQLRHALDFGVPSIGVRRDDLVLVVGDNVSARPSYSASSQPYATGIHVVGAGEGRDKPQGTAELVPQRRLRRMLSAAEPDLTTRSAAEAVAQRELISRNTRPTVSQITIRDHQNAPIGSIRMGDELPFQDESNPHNIVDTYVRVLSSTIDPKRGDLAQLTVKRMDSEA